MTESETKFGVTPFSIEPRPSHESGDLPKSDPAPAYSSTLVEEDLSMPAQPRQYTVTLSEGVIVPTLSFSYPQK